MQFWNKIFRKSNIRYKEEMIYGEDDFFRLMTFIKVKMIVTNTGVFYHYRNIEKEIQMTFFLMKEN